MLLKKDRIEIEEDFRLMCELRSPYIVHTSYLLRWLRFSAQTGTYEILLDSEEKPAGYIVWAKVCRETIEKIINYGEFPYFQYEWEEGHINLILDVCFSNFSNSSYSTNKLLKEKLRKLKTIAYYRKQNCKLVIRRNNRYKTHKFKLSDRLSGNELRKYNG